MTQPPSGDQSPTPEESGVGGSAADAAAREASVNSYGVQDDAVLEGEIVDEDVNTWAHGSRDEVPGAGEFVNDDAPQDPFSADETSAIADEHAAAAPESATAVAPEGAPQSDLAAERLADLQRLQAEYVNYKRRVDRDRAATQESAVQSVLDALLPVLDDIHAAREHGDLTDGPFASIADKLETTLSRFGLERFGEVGVEFDPQIHEALMHTAWDASNPALPADASATTVVTVLQPGYRQGERVIRPARVAVADPE